MEVLTVIGTRPEAIKMAPLLLRLQQEPSVVSRLCVTGQHREILAQVLDLFGLMADEDLVVMTERQDLTQITCRVLEGVKRVVADRRPDLVLVHGDTSTTMSAALAAFYAQVPVRHVEAGLRTGDLASPWPEEANRRLVSVLAERHYAPTESARANLLVENVPKSSILVTGNTVIDALHLVSLRLDDEADFRVSLEQRFDFLDPSRRLVLVTGHRRENFGDSMERVCDALLTIAARDDVEIVYPVHPNPNVTEPVKRRLGSAGNIHLIEPLDYLPFVYLMKRSYLIVTDSGGVQEEAPSLGKPVLVTRDTTERPEAVEAGTVALVGTDPARLVTCAAKLLDDEASYRRMSRAINPYGNGEACPMIVEDLLS